MALGSIHCIHMCSMSIHEGNMNVSSHATQSADNYLASSFDKINCVQLLVTLLRYANTGKLQNNGEFE